MGKGSLTVRCADRFGGTQQHDVASFGEEASCCDLVDQPTEWTTTRVMITWSKVSNASSYVVEFAPSVTAQLTDLGPPTTDTTVCDSLPIRNCVARAVLFRYKRSF